MEDLSNVIRLGTSLGLDFVNIDELRKRTGVISSGHLAFAAAEMLCNALDAGASEIFVSLGKDDVFHRLNVSDNGTKQMDEEDVRGLLDFNNKASSKRGLYRVSRGSHGNALKCIFGATFALSDALGLRPPPIKIVSHGSMYEVNLKPNKVEGAIESEIKVSSLPDTGGNSFDVGYPIDGQRASMEGLLDMLNATSMVNPHRLIRYDLWGRTGVLGDNSNADALRTETSVSWFTRVEFENYLNELVRVRPETALGGFIGQFRGFRGRRAVKEILQDLNGLLNHDSPTLPVPQFLPGTTISTLRGFEIDRLYDAMRKRAKPISARSIPKVLGSVGEKEFEEYRRVHGYTKLRYLMVAENMVEGPLNYPHLVEVAILDGVDGGGCSHRILECVNFMAASRGTFSSGFDVHERLAQVGVRLETPVTVLVHYVSPRLDWLNVAKNALYSPTLEKLLAKVFDKLLPVPKTPKAYHSIAKSKSSSWVPRGTLNKTPGYEDKLWPFAEEIKLINSQRTRPMKYSTRGWCYILEGPKLDKSEFVVCQKAINDCRKIGLLPIDFVAEDQDETRRFGGIHKPQKPSSMLRKLGADIHSFLDNLPSMVTDYWVGEEYYPLMCVEKGDIRNLFEPLCRLYHVPILSSKGWYPINTRNDIVELARDAEKRGLKPVLLLFYDHDPAGLLITKKFRKNLCDIQRATGWDPSSLIIERFGLNIEEIDKYRLTWINNLKTASGKEAKDPEYVKKFGRRKCESNALFKNEETILAGEKICRDTIEKYLGGDALGLFKAKEAESRSKLNLIYDSQLWREFYQALKKLEQDSSNLSFP